MKTAAETREQLEEMCKARDQFSPSEKIAKVRDAMKEMEPLTVTLTGAERCALDGARALTAAYQIYTEMVAEGDPDESVTRMENYLLHTCFAIWTTLGGSMTKEQEVKAYLTHAKPFSFIDRAPVDFFNPRRNHVKGA